MPFHQLTYQQQLGRLRSLAREVLQTYGLGDASIDLLKYQHHAIYRVTTRQGELLLLRISLSARNNPNEFKVQIAWQETLWQAHLPVPEPVRTLDGRLVGQAKLDESAQARYALMRWAPGRRIGKGVGRTVMRKAGAIAGQLHKHSCETSFPIKDSLPRWDVSTIAEPERWSVGLDKVVRATIQAATRLTQDALAGLNVGPETFGVIHADLHIENIVRSQGRLTVIDFGDCGQGFYLYDLAVMLSVVRNVIPSRAEPLIHAYLDGYAEVRALPKDADILFPSFLAYRDLVDTRVVLETGNWKVHQWLPSLIAGSTRRLKVYLETVGSHSSAWSFPSPSPGPESPGPE